MDRIVGIDVSFWQDNDATPQKIDFAKMKSSGAKFVIIRVGQNTWIDSDFVDNWNASRGILPRGSYWFYDSRVNPQGQAERWINALGNDLGELPLWCDFEDRYGGDYGTWKHWKGFIERIKTLLPQKEIGIYTGYWYWLEKTISVGISASSLEYFKQYPLWIANYGAISPILPKPWTNWLFWQYTESGDGYLYGTESGGVDLNYFNGNLDMFNERFNLGGNNSPTEPNNPSIIWEVVKASGRQVKLASVE